MSDYQFLKYEIKDGSAWITINRPEVYNALIKDAKFEIVSAIRAANKDENIQSIILTATGKAFCTGQDLNDRTLHATERAVDLGHTLETEWIPLTNAIRDSKKLVIGALNGVCAGAGLSVALACDLIVAKPGIKFISGFSKLGLCPDAGSSYIFVKAFGYQRTLEFFLFNKPLLAEELQEVGLINHISEDWLEVAESMASEINKMAPLSIEIIKKNVQKAQEQAYAESLENETASQRFLGNSEDYKEGLKAFFEKRPPAFKGS